MSKSDKTDQATRQGMGSEWAQFDSFLRTQFPQLLSQCGLQPPNMQNVVRESDTGCILRAEFAFESARLRILMDGQDYHAADRLKAIEDLDSRNELELSSQRLLEFTLHDVLHAQGWMSDTMKAMVGLGMIPPAPHAQTPGHHAFDLSESAWAFRRKLIERDPRFGERDFKISEGVSVIPLAVDQDRQLVLLQVDPDAWVADRDHWQFDLRVSNHLRLCGWLLVRVPTPWLTSRPGDDLIDRLPNVETIT